MWTSPRAIVRPATGPLFGGTLTVFSHHACVVFPENIVASLSDVPLLSGLIHLDNLVTSVFELNLLPQNS